MNCCSDIARELYSTNACFEFRQIYQVFCHMFVVLLSPSRQILGESCVWARTRPLPSESFPIYQSSYLYTPYNLDRITDDIIKEPQRPKVQGYYALQTAVQFVQPCGIRTWGAQCKTAAGDSSTYVRAYDTHLQTGR